MNHGQTIKDLPWSLVLVVRKPKIKHRRMFQLGRYKQDEITAPALYFSTGPHKKLMHHSDYSDKSRRPFTHALLEFQAQQGGLWTPPKRPVHGYVTRAGYFLNRADAFVHAFMIGQLRHTASRGPYLYDEDLFEYQAGWRIVSDTTPAIIHTKKERVAELLKLLPEEDA